MLKHLDRLAAAVAVAGLAGIATPALALDTKQFAVVGTWGQLDHWKARESKFWNETLPKASDGKLTANAKPLTELGMDGHKVMRDLKSGAFDFAHGVFVYVSADSPVVEGTDLSGLMPDITTSRKAMNAYKTYLNREFEQKFDSRILMLYAWDEINLFCKLPASTPATIDLAALKGLKVRSYGASVSEFITHTLDATPVPVAFGEVLPSLQKGTIDCGTSGILSGYDAKWYQVATHLVRISLGYTASFLAVNNRAWSALQADTRALLEREIAKFEDEMWAATAANDTRGLNCNTAGPCPSQIGGMKLVTLTPDAQAKMKASVNDNVVQKWADRCKRRSADCVQNWNASIGSMLGFVAR